MPPKDPSNNFPPPRRSPGLKSVSPPLSSTPLNRFIYILVFLTTLLMSFYCYRIVQYKTQVGGWWNLMLGKKIPAVSGAQGVYSSMPQGPKSGEHIIEDRINALAEALGMPSKDLASAIAVAVRQYVPPASLSSVAAKETGTVVQVLLNEEAVGDEDGGVVDHVVQGMESFVGMDEP